MYDLIIIGNGRAGRSAAEKAVESGLKTLVVSMENGSVEIQGADFINDEVVSLGGFEEITVTGIIGKYTGRALVLAIGAPKERPPFQNLGKFIGNGVSYCAACDGFFYTNRKIAVIGYNGFMAHEAPLIHGISENMSILTNGIPLDLNDRDSESISNIRIEEEKIKGFYGDDYLQGIEFSSGRHEAYEGVFMAYGSASVTELSMKTGLLTENGYIAIDEKGRTNLPHIFAAGSCATGTGQTGNSGQQGSAAAESAAEYIS